MNKRIFRIISIMFLALFSISCSSMTIKHSLGLLEGKIFFTSDDNGNPEVFSIDPNTKITSQITNNTANDYSPFYIASTNKLGFISDLEDGLNIWQMDLNGENMINITKGKNLSFYNASWSTDGKYIVTDMIEPCDPDSAYCNPDIFIMKSDGSDRINLTNTPSVTEWAPSFSPDGKKIVFVSEKDGDLEICVMDKDGSHLTQLTQNEAFDYMPRWSPDGSHIAFVSDRDGGDWDIFIMKSDGGSPRLITTNNGGNDFDPNWSPDGKWIIYVSDQDGDTEIVMTDLFGKNQKRFTYNNATDHYPVWVVNEE